MTKTLRERVALLETLPTLPSIITHLRAAIDSQRTSLKGLAAIVGSDPAMTARVLALLYERHPDFRGTVPPLPKAIAALGFNAVRDVAYTPAIDLSDAGPAPLRIDGLWGHAVGVAVAARTIAEVAGNLDPDACYTAGLLHDIGKIAMFKLEPTLFTYMAGSAGGSDQTFYQCEVATNMASHAVLGRVLAETWRYPSRLVEAIGWHHTPQLATVNARFVSTVHLADVLARALGLGWAGDDHVPPLHASTPPALGLRPAQVEDIMARIEDRFPGAVAVLGLAADDLYSNLMGTAAVSTPDSARQAAS